MVIRFAIMLCFSILTSAFAESVQISHQGLTLNADYRVGEKNEPIFVILHGTWMHQTNDLPSYLQEIVEYEGYSSLNLSLSLGIDNRETFMDCDTMPVVGGHHQAPEELKAWFDWLRKKGHNEFVLIGHSRGGAQAALFYQKYRDPGLKELILIAPATHEQSTVAKSFEERYSKNLNEQIKYFLALENQTDPLTEAAVLYCTFAKVSAEAFLSYYLPAPNKHTPDLISKIDIPTKIFLGSEDYLSDRLMEYQHEFAQNKNVTTYWIDGADHFFRDLYADEIFEEVLSDF